MKITIKKSTLRKAGKAIVLALVLTAVIMLIAWGARSCEGRERPEAGSERDAEPEVPKLMYDIPYEEYELITGEVNSGQTLSHILGNLGVNAAMIDRIDRECRPVFNMRNIRPGHCYTAFMQTDTTLSNRMSHFVYEKNVTDYVVVSMVGDSLLIREASKDVTVKRRKETAEIKSSLWNAMTANDLPVAISVEMEDIFGWSIDFFGLQPGDRFTVIFDERWIDSTRVGIGRIWGAEFLHNGKEYHAIPFRQSEKVEYWDENGKSLRKQLLKAPLKFSRISSKFSNARLHPILKVYRPHHGVDYAAPAGTPVVAIADGVVTFRGWDGGGGGNTLKLKHANNLSSGYLHLQGFAKGITVGTRVSQGQLIGYVGSTGRSTGPHLDFRLWKGGTAIDPLKAPSDPVEPISEENKEAFDIIKDKMLAEIHGDVPEEEKVTEI